MHYDELDIGAVEQLKTHCARLGVPLYERGYEKDPAKVAAEAVKQAERDGRHVVLVDTAGRMQVKTLLWDRGTCVLMLMP